MASQKRTSDPDLSLLQSQATELNFFQAVRLLEPSLDKDHQLRFKVENSDAFQPSFIAGVSHQTRRNKKITTVRVNGFGTTGMQGPVPQCYSEMLQRAEVRSHNGPEDPQSFLDIFHHRLISLLYEIKKHFNPLLFNEQPGNSELFQLFSSVCGLNMLDVFDRMPVSSDQLAAFAPVLANRRVDYSHVRNALGRYLDCEVKITPNQGCWKTLPGDFRAKLGRQGLSGVQEQGLGHGVGLGKRYWDNQAAIALTVNVKDIEQCRDLLPGGCEHKKLRAMLSFLTDGKYQFHVQLVIQWQQIPDSQLNQRTPLRLGQTAWLKPATTQPDSFDLCRFVVNPSIQHQFAEEQAA